MLIIIVGCMNLSPESCALSARPLGHFPHGVRGGVGKSLLVPLRVEED